MMKTYDCYNCKSEKHEFYFRENGFDMVKCSGCGLLYIRERPSDEEIAVATVAGEHHGEKNLHVDVYYNRNVIPWNKRILNSIFGTNYSGINTWLDVGCGHGEFIESLRDLTAGKIVVSGNEPNATKQASARSRGLNVSFFDLASHDTQYDMVSLLNVYSHLADPKAFIGAIHHVVKPGGQFLIQTGDAANLPASDQLKPLCLPDHMSFASEKILRDMLESHNFRVDSVHKFPALQPRLVQLAKEVAKLFIPGKNSFLKYYLNYSKYAEQNMYIRATRID
jgi:2-polyprenyl-3-methyl-5-hydroxy-6-metoxy-1,4-benzoquinol methylase